MVALGLVEFRQRGNLRHDGRTELSLRGLLGLLGGDTLSVAVIENHRAILRAGVSPLPVERGRIMRRPEDIQQTLERELLRVELDLRHLRVAGGAGANVFVGRVLLFAARVAARHGLHAVEPLKHRFGTPETAAAQRGQFRRIRGFGFVRVHFLGATARGHESQQSDAEVREQCRFHRTLLCRIWLPNPYRQTSFSPKVGAAQQSKRKFPCHHQARLENFRHGHTTNSPALMALRLLSGSGGRARPARQDSSLVLQAGHGRRHEPHVRARHA